MIPDTYLDQPVPDDIAKQWHRWEGAKWRQNAYVQKHAGHGQPPPEHPNMHPPEDMCVAHESEWRRWQGREYRSPWAGTILDGAIDDAKDEQRQWDDTNQSQMILIETACGQGQGCSTVPYSPPVTAPPTSIKGDAPLRVCMRGCGGDTCWCGRDAGMLIEARRFLPGSSPSAAESTADTVELLRRAVPMYLAEIAREAPSRALLYRRLDWAATVVGAYGEGLAGFAVTKPKQRKRVEATANCLAYALAVASLQPGGIHCYGVHFETTGATHNPLEEP